MTSQILYNIKSYMAERNSQLTDIYECTNSDYPSDKFDFMSELSNFNLLIDENDLYTT